MARVADPLERLLKQQEKLERQRARLEREAAAAAAKHEAGGVFEPGPRGTPMPGPAPILIGYGRTSTAEQEAGLEAQRRDLETAGCGRVFTEQASSVGTRPQLERALDYVREGDTLVVTKIDRLARSTTHLWDIVRDLDAKGVNLRVLNLGGETVDTKSATGRLILNIFAGFAQFEREMMLERQKEGIAKAKAEGRYTGRKPSARLKADDARRLHAEGRTVTEIAKTLAIGRASVYRALGMNPAKAPDTALPAG
ncbi:recombinase family protein [Ancylobacter amanitiformis]|uniref:DNA invertase Pin-like site-specific DNA recombinase n=1 Tax=Ancylobacter amanitiformis TaxID=217069 RepID=A0ABU0LSP7_9HYPH|nr:recombinase family protein [Ancylobacter amanitiformis]MDQ0511711.1 DNA invertase Pin-like site-specific DNA recombinase [Ancylobacter amanitiformis]